jgi:hypothetical protein
VNAIHAAHQGRARALCVAACIAVLAFNAQRANAQDYPSKSVRMVAGMAAGGGADANARRLAQMLGKILAFEGLRSRASGGYRSYPSCRRSAKADFQVSKPAWVTAYSCMPAHRQIV